MQENSLNPYEPPMCVVDDLASSSILPQWLQNFRDRMRYLGVPLCGTCLLSGMYWHQGVSPIAASVIAMLTIVCADVIGRSSAREHESVRSEGSEES